MKFILFLSIIVVAVVLGLVTAFGTGAEYFVKVCHWIGDRVSAILEVLTEKLFLLK